MTTFEDVTGLTQDPEDQITEEVVEQTSETTEETDDSDPLAVATYQSLVERGIFDEDENFTNSFDYIEEKLDELPNKLLRKAIDERPAFSKGVLDYVFEAGSNLSEDEFKTFIKTFLKEQDVPDVSTADSAREFLEKTLVDQGLAAPAIQAQLDYLEDNDLLVKNAQELLDKRTKESEKLTQQKIEENKRIQEDRQKFTDSVNNTLKEMNWSKKQQDVVFDAMNRSNDIIQKTIQNPKAYVQLMDFLSKFNGKEFDIEDYRKQGESRAVSKFKEKIENSGFSSTSVKTNTVAQDKKKETTDNPFANIL